MSPPPPLQEGRWWSRESLLIWDGPTGGFPPLPSSCRSICRVEIQPRRHPCPSSPSGYYLWQPSVFRDACETSWHKLAAPPPPGLHPREARAVAISERPRSSLLVICIVVLKGPMLNKNCHKTPRDKPTRCSPAATLQRHRPVDRVKQPTETASDVGGSAVHASGI